MKLPKELLLSELLNFSVKGNGLTFNYGSGENVWMHPPVHRILGWYSRPSNFDLKRNVWRLNQISQIIDNEIYVKGDPAISDLALISADAQDIGNANESIPVSYSGENFDIAFNVRYLLEGLKVISSQNVIFKFNLPTTPAVLVPEDNINSFTYLVMPVQVRS